jgi:tRNA-specific 2-thiouridylase
MAGYSRKKVAVGLSGGVDSSVSAALLQEKGYDVFGITMEIFDESLPIQEAEKHACYGPKEREDSAAAEAVCNKLGISFHVLDLRSEYRSHVIAHFKKEYLEGKTPNPCVICNRELKFGFLLEKAKNAGVDFDFFATGHYARIEESSGRFLLKKAIDQLKDQSYFLYALSPGQLSRILLPLGYLTKQQVRKIARTIGLHTADRPESQDFISGGNYAVLFDKNEAIEGEIVDDEDNVLGKHRGIINYTIGQRRGLGIAFGRPLYVSKIDAANNRIVVSNKKNLLSRGLIASNLNLLAIDKLDRPYQASVKIRLNHPAVAATVYLHEYENVKILFDEPQEAVCPGQHAVFYSEDTVIGGGVIQQAIGL